MGAECHHRRLKFVLGRVLKERIEVVGFAAHNPLAWCIDPSIHRKCHGGRIVSISQQTVLFPAVS